MLYFKNGLDVGISTSSNLKGNSWKKPLSNRGDKIRLKKVD